MTNSLQLMLRMVARPTAHNFRAESHQGMEVRFYCAIVYGWTPAMLLITVELDPRIEMTVFLPGALNLGSVARRQCESENGAAGLVRVHPQSPEWASMMERQIDRPIPTPPALVV
jgi:hypothetical protein